MLHSCILKGKNLICSKGAKTLQWRYFEMGYLANYARSGRKPCDQFNPTNSSFLVDIHFSNIIRKQLQRATTEVTSLANLQVS